MPAEANIHIMALNASLLVTFVNDFLLVNHFKFVDLLLVGTVVQVVIHACRRQLLSPQILALAIVV